MIGWKGLSFFGYIVGRLLFRGLYIWLGALNGRELKKHLSPKMLSQISTWTKSTCTIHKITPYMSLLKTNPIYH